MKIMECIADATDGKSYNTFKYSFDREGMPSMDYDDDGGKQMSWSTHAETLNHKKAVNLTKEVNRIIESRKAGEKPLITYFLDGSRHVYKVDDISYDNRVYPVMAGQVGVGCCKRQNGIMIPEKLYNRFVISLPKNANADGWNDEGFFASRTKLLNELPILKKFGIQFTAILPYEEPKDKEKVSLESSGIARIQDFMIESEKEMVSELVKTNRLGQDNYLLKDGSLEYKPMKSGRIDFRVLEKIKGNYRWVIGVSKSFNPESLKDSKGKPNANYIADLPLFYRTPVALYTNEEHLGNVKFAVWYIRLRDKFKTRTPFDGVIKVEKVLMDDEDEKGVDSEEVDLISANLIIERNPTCYGTDKRWANHLYPVFLTESFVKSKYLSDEFFLNLF